MRKITITLFVIPILVLAVLWSLTNNNNNNDINQDIKIYYEKHRSEILVEVNPVEMISTVRSIKMPDPVVMPKIITVVPEKVSKEHEDQIRCMAHNIYYEAGGESHWGQVAVARVVMNRVDHGFAANPCQVIYQSNRVTSSDGEREIIRCQFSWVCQGKKSPDITSERYLSAKDIARRVIIENQWADEFNPNVLFFHNHAVNPRWPYKREFVIGNHVFYAKNSTK